MNLPNPLDYIVVNRHRLWQDLLADESGPFFQAEQRGRAALAMLENLLEGTLRLARDFPELRREALKGKFQKIRRELATATTAEELRRLGGELCTEVQHFADRQERLVSEREGEVRRILGLVSTSLQQSRSSSQELVSRLEGTVQGIEESASLDDLRQLRASLARNLEQLRETVAQAAAQANPAEEVLREVEELRFRLCELEVAAMRDPLTGAHNRRAFDGALAGLIAEEAEFTLVLCDMNGLKQVNDTLGHAFGDQSLRKMARQLQAVFRPADMVARLGGDEFAVVARLDAADVADRLGRIFRPRRGPAGSKPSMDPGAVSASFGVAARRPGETAEELYDRADRLMYSAKDEGQNVIRCE